MDFPALDVLLRVRKVSFRVFRHVEYTGIFKRVYSTCCGGGLRGEGSMTWCCGKWLQGAQFGDGSTYANSQFVPDLSSLDPYDGAYVDFRPGILPRSTCLGTPKCSGRRVHAADDGVEIGDVERTGKCCWREGHTLAPVYTKYLHKEFAHCLRLCICTRTCKACKLNPESRPYVRERLYSVWRVPTSPCTPQTADPTCTLEQQCKAIWRQLSDPKLHQHATASL